MSKRGNDRLTSSIWERALRHGDPLAEELIDDAVKALGAGVASAVNLLDIEAVVIGGGLGVRLGEPYVERIRKRMGATSSSTATRRLRARGARRPRRRHRRLVAVRRVALRVSPGTPGRGSRKMSAA